MGSKCKSFFLGPSEGISLHETTSFHIFIVQISAVLSVLGCRLQRKNHKTSRATWCSFLHIWVAKWVIMSWWNFA